MAQKGRKGGRGRKAIPSQPHEGRITFDYVKSNLYRIIHCDGIVGGVTPNGLIHMAVWSHHRTYPEQVVHELGPEGQIGKEIERTKRAADITRELEADFLFSPALARVIITWLEGRLKEFERASMDDEHEIIG